MGERMTWALRWRETGEWHSGSPMDPWGSRDHRAEFGDRSVAVARDVWGASKVAIVRITRRSRADNAAAEARRQLIQANDAMGRVRLALGAASGERTAVVAANLRAEVAELRAEVARLLAERAAWVVESEGAHDPA